MGFFSSLTGDGGAAERAANVAADAQRAAAALQKGQYDTTAANYKPYVDAGTGALGSYQNLASGLPGQFNPILGQMGTTVNSMQPIVDKLTSSNLNDYQTAPGYDFRMQQGIKAIQNSAAANGTLNSGNTLKALTQYGQDYGTNDYQTYLGNLQNQLTAVNGQLGAQGNYLNSTINSANTEMAPYANLMQQGANMTQGLGQLGANSAALQGQYIAGAGATTASGMQATANSLQQAGNNVMGIGMAAAGMPGMGPQTTSGQLNLQPYQGNGYVQPQQMNQPQQTPVQGTPWLQQSQPQQSMPTGTNYFNPTQGGGQSNGWKI